MSFEVRSSFPEVASGFVSQRRCRVFMIAPTRFFADYGCHVRIPEREKALGGSGRRLTIVTKCSGNPVPGLNIRRTTCVPGRRTWRSGAVVGLVNGMLALIMGARTVRKGQSYCSEHPDRASQVPQS
jgi:hypothetical protein